MPGRWPGLTGVPPPPPLYMKRRGREGWNNGVKERVARLEVPNNQMQRDEDMQAVLGRGW
eukprot:5385225-Pyramimonas_sp.AAC.1